MYEWLPWVAGDLEVPKDPARGIEWLRKTRSGGPCRRGTRGGPEALTGAKADAVRNVEAFELCEYGRRPAGTSSTRAVPL